MPREMTERLESRRIITSQKLSFLTTVWYFDEGLSFLILSSANDFRLSSDETGICWAKKKNEGSSLT